MYSPGSMFSKRKKPVPDWLKSSGPVMDQGKPKP